jgi:mono/diheme cytochrome c family protein
MGRLSWVLILCCAAAAAQTKPGDADNGKRLYLKNGCYQCHGQSGQGGLAGARLAQTKLAQAAFIAYVRNPAPGGMPPYRTLVMTDRELADVWTYIKTFPEPAPANSIPLLNSARGR